MVDIEESRVVVSCKDENSILPPKLRKSLRSALTLATTALPATALPDSEQNVLVSETFLRFFVEVCGHYAHHVLPQPDGLKAFQVCYLPIVKNKKFKKNVSCSALPHFLFLMIFLL